MVKASCKKPEKHIPGHRPPEKQLLQYFQEGSKYQNCKIIARTLAFTLKNVLE
jgi:hypothetical protein